MVSISNILNRVGLPLVVIAGAALVATWFVVSRPQALPKPPQEKVWPVTVVDVAPADVQPELVLYGAVMAAREAEIRAMVAGRLVSLAPAFKNGSRIQVGTELAIIDPVDYEHALASARADLARADAELSEISNELKWERALQKNAGRQLVLAERAFARTEKLAASGRESQKARDEAENMLAGAEQERLQREQTLARLEARLREQKASYEKLQVGLASAERELAHTRVVAPFSGNVTDVRLALGQRVAVGERLGRLLSADALEVRFDIPEADFARITTEPGANVEALIGRRVRVVWRLGEIEQVFDATVGRIGAEIDPSLGGIEVYANLGTEASRNGLKAGAFVEIHLPERTYRQVWRLPARALTNDNDVFALVDGRLQTIAVELVRDLGDEVLVRGALDAGHPVVARTFPGIGPGLLARPL